MYFIQIRKDFFTVNYKGGDTFENFYASKLKFERVVYELFKRIFIVLYVK